MQRRRFRPAVERVEDRRLADGGGGAVLASVFPPPPPGASSDTTPPPDDPGVTPDSTARAAFNLTAAVVGYFYPPGQ